MSRTTLTNQKLRETDLFLVNQAIKYFGNNYTSNTMIDLEINYQEDGVCEDLSSKPTILIATMIMTMENGQKYQVTAKLHVDDDNRIRDYFYVGHKCE